MFKFVLTLILKLFFSEVRHFSLTNKSQRLKKNPVEFVTQKNQQTWVEVEFHCWQNISSLKKLVSQHLQINIEQESASV